MADNSRDRFLFEVEPTPWEVDEQARVCVARVVFSEGMTEPLDYRVPDSLLTAAAAGKRVLVPLGRSNRATPAFCVEILPQEPSGRPLKEILRVLDEKPLLSAAMLRLTRWMADQYLTPWGKVLETVLPAAVREQAGVRMQTVYRAVDATAGGKWPPKQQAVLDLVRAAPGPLTMQQIMDRIGCTGAPVQGLCKKGALVAEQQAFQKEVAWNGEVETAIPLHLHTDQQQSVEAIVRALRESRHETFLLHGVTGSGKTEVYIRAIEETITYGRQAIVLVPEISLTPQTQRRFRARFRHVAVLHSHLTDAERHWHWQRIARGEVQVIVGARSAVFAPTPHLGLVILDEEHDGSFKQDSLPRYHARDVAEQRARTESIPLVLGSATPSLETWQRARDGHATLLSMPRRVQDRPLPDVVLVDMRQEFQQRASRSPIGRRLQQAMKQALEANEQVILLLNRRGFSTHIQCPACGEVIRCPDCELALTHHREGDKAVCHYCDFTIAAPPVCPKCRFDGIRYAGLGTQRLEAEVVRRFPHARCLRMDSDTMRRPGSHEEALARFRRGEVQILLGTQMIAKGLDFPNVTVVGVINADSALHLPDFRAAERTFQLVTQVAGRTGRGEKGGRVYVQTLQPDHPAIEAAERHDYVRFACQELEAREQFGYPPFGRMVRIIVRGPDLSRTEDAAQRLADGLAELENACPGFRLLGPAPAPIEKLRGNYRFHLILRADELGTVRDRIRLLQKEKGFPDDVQWVADVDPMDML